MYAVIVCYQVILEGDFEHLFKNHFLATDTDAMEPSALFQNIPTSLRFCVFPFTNTSAPISLAFWSLLSTISVASLQGNKEKNKGLTNQDKTAWSLSNRADSAQKEAGVQSEIRKKN